MDNRWLKVENIVAKGEIACFEQFLLLSLTFSKSRLLQRRQKASIWEKGLIESLNTEYCWRHCGKKRSCSYQFDFLLFSQCSLSHLLLHFDAIAADDFWKHCGQRWTCSWWAISPLATIFSTSTIKPSFMEIFQVFVTTFSKSSAADLLYVGKG